MPERLPAGRIRAHRTANPGDLRLNWCAMVDFFEIRRLWLIGLAVLLLGGPAAWSQNGAGTATSAQGSPNENRSRLDSSGDHAKPISPQPDGSGIGKNHRLILKDGSFQLVRDYQVVGDRVRYLSQERGEWEELPADLVDWDATHKWEKEQSEKVGDVSPAMKEAEELDKEESEERNEEKARRPEVVPGLELPDEDGVFVLDTYQGTPELVELNGSELSVNAKNRKGMGVLNPMLTQKASLEIQGSHARVHLHVDQPAIYLSLSVDEQSEPVLTHPITVDTHGAKAVNGKHGAHSPQSGFVIVRVDERQAVRVVGAIKMSPNGTITQDENTIPTKVEELPGKRWLRVTPQQSLSFGEYALVEILSPSDLNESVWDFRVDPRTGDNRGAIGPILKQPRE